MHGTSQSIVMTIVVFVMMMIGVLFGLAVFTENNSQLTSNQAMQTALLDARDDSGRVVRGTYVINTDRFEQDLLNSNIDNWRKIDNKLNHAKNSHKADRVSDPNAKYSSNARTSLSFYYLNADSSDAKAFNKLNAENKRPIRAIKAVKVIVTSNREMTASDAKKLLEQDRKKKNIYGARAVLTGAGIGQDDIADQILSGKISGNTKVWLTEPKDVITYEVNSLVNISPDDIYDYSPTKDYNSQEYANSEDREKGKRTDQYLDNHDVTNENQENEHVAQDMQNGK